ncbi:hypothetical protein HYDPIDRAFT_33326 [Hydnomerulius pinastri MD-312]|uniref:DUF6533 domain-containing protein n=1 Tax=Hydnomerulius pinastri MD-312 TaxID=994086 RepID=A0A0C9W8C1_9AGAM|nr:hypothetical protein HYDPIDRAFT_33326 [Hydnomerulius pinastri MD-312]
MSLDNSLPEAPNTYAELVFHLLTAFLYERSPAVIILYDHMLTLDQEIEYIWNQPSIAAILYVPIRYLGDAVAVYGDEFYLLSTNDR